MTVNDNTFKANCLGHLPEKKEKLALKLLKLAPNVMKNPGRTLENGTKIGSVSSWVYFHQIGRRFFWEVCLDIFTITKDLDL